MSVREGVGISGESVGEEDVRSVKYDKVEDDVDEDNLTLELVHELMDQ
jgi:hypothetical protein